MASDGDVVDYYLRRQRDAATLLDHARAGFDTRSMPLPVHFEAMVVEQARPVLGSTAVDLVPAFSILGARPEHDSQWVRVRPLAGFVPQPGMIALYSRLTNSGEVCQVLFYADSERKQSADCG